MDREEGAAATLIYVGLNFGRPEPIAYMIAHVLKLLGGSAGGFFALEPAAANASARKAL